MATISTSLILLPVVNLVVAKAIDQTAKPFAEVVCSGQKTWPAVIATNDALFTFTINLPNNYVYRIQEIRVRLDGPSNADLADVSPLIAVNISEDGVANKDFPLGNITPRVAQDSSIAAAQVRSPANTDDFSMYYLPLPGDMVFNDIINGSGSTPLVTLGLTNPDNAGTTAQLQCTAYVRFYSYTIEQFHNSEIWQAAAVL